MSHSFRHWATHEHPPHVEILRAVSAAFGARPVDVDAELDDLGRRLFDIDPADVRAAAERTVELLADFVVDRHRPDALLLDTVLETRTGHPQLLTVILAEAARRAGFQSGVLSSPGRWYAAIGAPGQRAVLIAPADPGCTRPPGMARRHCGHELALAVLLGLRQRGDGAQVRIADLMLAELGYDEDAEADPLRALWTG